LNSYADCIIKKTGYFRRGAVLSNAHTTVFFRVVIRLVKTEHLKLDICNINSEQKYLTVREYCPRRDGSLRHALCTTHAGRLFTLNPVKEGPHSTAPKARTGGIFLLTGFETRTVQPVSSRYTDRAIPNSSLFYSQYLIMLESFGALRSTLVIMFIVFPYMREAKINSNKD
jgi:hypothetical protein